MATSVTVSAIVDIDAGHARGSFQVIADMEASAWMNGDGSVHTQVLVIPYAAIDVRKNIYGCATDLLALTAILKENSKAANGLGDGGEPEPPQIQYWGGERTDVAVVIPSGNQTDFANLMAAWRAL